MQRNTLTKEFQERVISWYRSKGRVFYWRTRQLNLWQWLFLELLLKKTRAETVERVFPSLVAKYFEPKVVVETSDLELQRDLQYLGLYRQRSRALKLISRKIVSKYNGAIPADEATLESLPHVGRYISNAVLCFGHGKKRPIVDSNIARVLTRFHGLEMPKDAREEWVWDLAEKMLPNEDWVEYNYGIIDIGSVVCKKTTPKCSSCCLQDYCSYGTKRR